MKKLVIFDVDGLLLNTEFSWQKVWYMLGREYGYPQLGDVFSRTVGLSGNDTKMMIRKCAADIPIPIQEEFLERARGEGASYVQEHLTLMPGARALLAELKRNGISCAVATTTNREFTEQRLNQVNVRQFFKCVVCGDEVAKRKPDPEIYLTVLEKTGTSKEEALILEDTNYGVEAAYRAGVDVIMVPSINLAEEVDRKRALAVLNRLTEVFSYGKSHQMFSNEQCKY